MKKELTWTQLVELANNVATKTYNQVREYVDNVIEEKRSAMAELNRTLSVAASSVVEKVTEYYNQNNQNRSVAPVQTKA